MTSALLADPFGLPGSAVEIPDSGRDKNARRQPGQKPNRRLTQQPAANDADDASGRYENAASTFVRAAFLVLAVCHIGPRSTLIAPQCHARVRLTRTVSLPKNKLLFTIAFDGISTTDP